MASGLPGMGGLGKRGLGLGASPPSHDSSSDEEALLGLGGSRGGSSTKRRRGAAGGSMTAAPPAACQNPLSGPLFDNPLFEDDGFEILADEDDDDDEQEPYWLRGMPVSSGSGGGGKENTPVAPKAGSQDCFAEFTPAAAPTCPLSSFLAELNSTSVLCALTSLEMRGLHPVGDDAYATLDVTIAGMLVLCRRASYGADEMSPELLLTCLWLLMSTCSQYRAGLGYNANLFLHLHPDGAAMVEGLQADMVALQRQVLQRASWRVLLRDTHELHAAINDLLACPDYETIASHIERCAEEGWQPLGTHGHSPATEAARLACHAAAEEGGAVGKGASRVPPPAPRVRNSGSSRSGHSGLDGSYWQTMAPDRRRSGGRHALAPRNR
ncbi:hypothetical protein ABPG75_005475 [Micractinium tetrahymenae]